MTPAQHLALHAVLRDVAAERHRQHAVHGEQELAYDSAYFIRDLTEKMEGCARRAQQNGEAGWIDLIAEEFCEAVRAPTWPARRAELVQLAALCVQAVEAIDRAEAARATGEAA